MSLTHTAVEIAPRPDGRRRWRVGARTYSEVILPEGGEDGPASAADVDDALLRDDFKRTLTARQRAAFDDLLQDIPAATHARRHGVDGSVARRRFKRVAEKYASWCASQE